MNSRKSSDFESESDTSGSDDELAGRDSDSSDEERDKLYENTFRIKLAQLDRLGTKPPQEIVSVILSQDEKKMKLLVEHFPRVNGEIQPQVDMYVIKNLNHMQIVSKLIAGKISSLEAFDLVAEERKLGTSSARYVLNACNFIFQCIGQPFAKQQQRMVDGKIQEAVKDFINFLTIDAQIKAEKAGKAGLNFFATFNEELLPVVDEVAKPSPKM